MNTLSTLLYLADVATSFKQAILVLASILLCALPFIVVSIASDSIPISWKWGWVFVFVGVLYCLIPSQNTIYAIAASELGESALKSKIGEKSLKALELWLDNQIEKKTK